MKKLIILFTLLVSFTLSYSQIDLLKGITSGMSEIEYINHCRLHKDITLGEKGWITDIKGRTYQISTTFNNNDELKVVTLISCIKYSKITYDEIKTEITDINNILSTKYGKEILKHEVISSEIPNEQYSIAQTFQKESVISLIYVTERNDKYCVFIYIGDQIYTRI